METSDGIGRGMIYVQRSSKELRMPRSHKLDLIVNKLTAARSKEENKTNGFQRQQPLQCHSFESTERYPIIIKDKVPINSKCVPKLTAKQRSEESQSAVFWENFSERSIETTRKDFDQIDFILPENEATQKSDEVERKENQDKYPTEMSTRLKDKNVPVHVGIDTNDRYKILGYIGSGNFGKICKVADFEKGMLAAAKEIPYNCNEDKETIKKETDILTLMLGNEFILQIYEVIDSCNSKPMKMIVITEYLDGGDLFERNTSGDLLTETKVIDIINQILEGVAFIHSKNVIHRDLKPENIMYPSKSSSKIKIIDFGFAVEFEKSNPPKSMVGTTIFVSPEVLNYDCQNFQTDIWSIGVLAYDLLAGITPFEIPRSGDIDRNLSDWEIRENIQRCEYDFEDEGFIGISDEAKDFISNILVKQPEKRLTSAQCFEHPWLKSVRKVPSKNVVRSVSIHRMKSYVASNNDKCTYGQTS